MLLRLMLIRLGPLVLLRFCKERKNIKIAGYLIMAGYAISFLAAVWKIFLQEKWLSILYLPLSMFPHYLCYGFALWMLIRCIHSAWSARVWNRIYFLSVMSVLLGILLENYINPPILQFFIKILK